MLNMMISSWPPAWLTPVDESALDGDKGKLAIEFVESFGIITKDSVAGRAGSPLKLRDWQKELIKYLYASDGRGEFVVGNDVSPFLCLDRKSVV